LSLEWHNPAGFWVLWCCFLFWQSWKQSPGPLCYMVSFFFVTHFLRAQPVHLITGSVMCTYFPIPLTYRVKFHYICEPYLNTLLVRKINLVTKYFKDIEERISWKNSTKLVH
jgi:hypothetical protein